MKRGKASKKADRYISQRELAKELGVSHTAVGEWDDAGELPHGENGKILRKEGIEAGRARAAQIAEREQSTAAARQMNAELLEARRDKERAIADLRRVEANLAAGRYVELAVVERDGQEAAERILAVLRAIPQRTALVLECPCNRAAIVETKIREEVERAIAEMNDSMYLKAKT